VPGSRPDEQGGGRGHGRTDDRAVTLADDLAALARFGADGGGVSREAWTPVLLEAYDWVAGRLRALGFAVDVDPAGNLLGRWEAGDGPAVLVGSHLDSVPNGGRFDGALGVLAGLDAIRALREGGFEPARPVWLAAFMDEEGSRFGAGMLGSRAFCGHDVTPLLDRRDRDGTSVAQAMTMLGFDPARIASARGVDGVGAYLELHIEQGPVLEARDAAVGVVTGIAGLTGLHATFTGRAGHAGTTPMEGREDALVAAAQAVLAVREAGRGGVMATVGRMTVRPGAYNVIPSEVELTIDLRSPDAEALAAAEARLRERLEGAALRDLHRMPPQPMDATLRAHLHEAAAVEGATAIDLPSGAGHDAMILARHVPAAMLFVPSRGGVSHHPDELTTPEQCAVGARVLARAVERLAA
jgi:allantoate deiminase